MLTTAAERRPLDDSNLPNIIVGILSDQIIVGGYDVGKGEAVRYVFAVMNLNAGAIVSELQETPGISAHDFQTQHISGIFVSIDKTLILIVSARDRDLVKNFEIFNQSMDARLNDEVRCMARKLGFDNLADYGHSLFKTMLTGYYSVLARLNDTFYEKIETDKAVNSFLHLIENHKKLTRGQYFQAEYHLQFFSWIYYVEMQFIGEVMSKEKSVKIHDVATNTAFFPMLLSSLEKNETFGVDYQGITCSDIDIGVVRNSISAINERAPKKYKDISLLQLDLTQDNEILGEADVVVANDILEHFPEDLSFEVFETLWKHTRRFLIIHVPFEDFPTEAYGHFSKFNKQKLAEWSSRLQVCKDITSEYSYVASGNVNEKFIDEFLFLEKIDN
jgi:hypothetical protein